MFIKNINSYHDYSSILIPKNNKISDNSKYDDFAQNAQEILKEMNREQNNAQKNTEKFESKQSNISLNEILIDWQKSSISIQMAVQVKNKLISAYQEIMNQQV
ncbi:flagellar hook-basal body complex protein FliE [Buchnera aphidicola]|uniref:flagellar hook-basal body complex protein FliE n=1 Tax=Buchnera aphidicola TaxID=9 RepID=UPI003BEEC8D4